MKGQGRERLENEKEFKIGEKPWGKGLEGKRRCVRKRKPAPTNAEERFPHLRPLGGALWTFFPHQNKQNGVERREERQSTPPTKKNNLKTHPIIFKNLGQRTVWTRNCFHCKSPAQPRERPAAGRRPSSPLKKKQRSTVLGSLKPET